MRGGSARSASIPPITARRSEDAAGWCRPSRPCTTASTDTPTWPTPRSSTDSDTSDTGRTAYALAVFLLAPVAIVVPLTISTAIGASTIVGERERGTGEFLAHSPAHEREIYLGKLIASLVSGYATTLAGFGIYSIIVNLFVGPEVGGWFFPTAAWWVLMLWVVPPFLALTLSIVLRLSRGMRAVSRSRLLGVNDGV